MKKEKKKYEVWYETVMLPIRKITRTGGRYVVTIPKNIIDNKKLRKGSHVGVCIFIRRKKFSDETIVLSDFHESPKDDIFDIDI